MSASFSGGRGPQSERTGDDIRERFDGAVRASVTTPAFLAYRQPRYLASNRQTGGFASPPYDGFALTVRGELSGKKSFGQTVCIFANVAKWRLPYAGNALMTGCLLDDCYAAVIKLARKVDAHGLNLQLRFR